MGGNSSTLEKVLEPNGDTLGKPLKSPTPESLSKDREQRRGTLRKQHKLLDPELLVLEPSRDTLGKPLKSPTPESLSKDLNKLPDTLRKHFKLLDPKQPKFLDLEVLLNDLNKLPDTLRKQLKLLDPKQPKFLERLDASWKELLSELDVESSSEVARSFLQELADQIDKKAESMTGSDKALLEAFSGGAKFAGGIINVVQVGDQAMKKLKESIPSEQSVKTRVPHQNTQQ